MRPIAYYRSLSTLVAFIAVFALFASLSPGHYFIAWGNIKILLVMISEFCVILLGVGLLMISGEFDLSIPSALLFCSFIFLKLHNMGLNLFLSAFIVFGVGLLIGLVNGLITTKGRIPSFITTLATMMLWAGITSIFAPPGAERAIDVSVLPLFRDIFTGEVWGVPVQFLWFILFTLIAAVLLHFHKLGCWIYVTGDNKEAARAMGINTDLVKITCFMLVGFLCAFSAIMQIIRVEAFHVVLGNLYELQAIAACVIGTVSLFGGRGSVLGCFLGAIIIPMMQNGIVFLPIPVAGTTAFVGMAIVIFTFVSTFTEMKMIRKKW
jgi:simple sugar transport system permease protein